MQRQPRHPPEFQAKLALAALAGQASLQELAARHGIPEALLRRWCNQLQRGAPGLFRSRWQRLARLLWPPDLGQRCLLAIVMGVLLGQLLPGSVAWLAPLGAIGLQASQLVVMPYLVCEVLHALGSMPAGFLGTLLRRGGLALLLLWLVGGVAMLVMPAMLPPLLGSDFFTPALLTVPDPADLLRATVPANLFQALASDNVPAVVLVCSVLGVRLQRHADRGDLLRPLAVLRALVRDLNRIVAGLIPLSIVALIARSTAASDLTQLLRLQALFWITLVGGLVVVLLLTVLLLGITPLRPQQLWQLSAGPLGLAFGSGNALVALPLLLANLRSLIAELHWVPRDRQPLVDEEMTAAVVVGFALPGLGQVMALVCVPFLGWYIDQPMGLPATLRVLMIGWLSVMGGLKSAVREGLRLQGLPLDLLQVLDLVGVWMYRFEKLMTLVGLITLALLVVTSLAGQLRLRPRSLLLGLALAGGLAWLGGGGVRGGLAQVLQGSYRKDQIVLNRIALQPLPVRSVQLPAPAPVTLAALRGRKVLRLGVSRETMPWAYRNAAGDWVGFDLDLLRRLAKELGLSRIDLVEGSQFQLEAWLEQGRLDMVAGGVVGTPGRYERFQVSEPYLRAHLGLVVTDGMVGRIQDLQSQPLGRPRRLALLDGALETPLLREQLDRLLGHGRTRVILEPISGKEAFFSAAGRQRFDGLLIPAEAGAAWAVVHPDTTLLVPFADALPVRLVLLIGGSDPDLRDWVNGWLAIHESQGGQRHLYDHWILMRTASQDRKS